MNFGQTQFISTYQPEPQLQAIPGSWQHVGVPANYPYSPYRHNIPGPFNSANSGIPNSAIGMSSQGSRLYSNTDPVHDLYGPYTCSYDPLTSTYTWKANKKNHETAADQGSKQSDPPKSLATSSATPCTSSTHTTSTTAPKVDPLSILVESARRSISSEPDNSWSSMSTGSSSSANTSLESNSSTDASLAAVDTAPVPDDSSATNVRSSNNDSLFALASVATSDDDTKSKEKTTNSNSSSDSADKTANEACSKLEGMRIENETKQESERTDQLNCAGSSKADPSILPAKEPHLTPLKTIEGEMLQVAQSNGELKAQQSEGISEPVKSTTTTSTQQNGNIHCRGHPPSTFTRSLQSTGTNTSTTSPITNNPPALSPSDLFEKYLEILWKRKNQKINEKTPKTNANPPASSTITSSPYPQPQPTHSSQPPQNTNINESSSPKILQQNDSEPLIDSQTPTHVRDIILRALAIEPYIGPTDYRSPTEFIEQFEMYAELLKLNSTQKRVLFIRWAYPGNKYMKAMKTAINYEQAVKEFLNEMWAQKKIAYNLPSSSIRGTGPGRQPLDGSSSYSSYNNGNSNGTGGLPSGGTSFYSYPGLYYNNC